MGIFNLLFPELITFQGQDFVLIILLALFLILAYHALKIIYRTILISLLGGMFPFVANKVLGLEVSTDIHTVMTFAIIAGILYIVYEKIKLGYHVLKFMYSLVRLLLSPVFWLVSLLKGTFRKKKHAGKQSKKQK